MEKKILAARTNELETLFGSRPFIALPQEEIDRLHASVEVLSVNHDHAEEDALSSLRQLVVYIAIHHNYSWLSCQTENGNDKPSVEKRCLGFTGHIAADGRNDIFLDESIKGTAGAVVGANVRGKDGYDLRLAGLINDHSTSFGRMHLGLVYIARLRQAGAEDLQGGKLRLKFHGMGELSQMREKFDPWSAILIDHLVAF